MKYKHPTEEETYKRLSDWTKDTVVIVDEDTKQEKPKPKVSVIKLPQSRLKSKE